MFTAVSREHSCPPHCPCQRRPSDLLLITPYDNSSLETTNPLGIYSLLTALVLILRSWVMEWVPAFGRQEGFVRFPLLGHGFLDHAACPGATTLCPRQLQECHTHCRAGKQRCMLQSTTQAILMHFSNVLKEWKRCILYALTKKRIDSYINILGFDHFKRADIML